MAKRTAKVDPAELVGAAEVAELLGWSQRQVAAYFAARRAGMPEPVHRVRATPLWLRSQILAWGRGRGYLDTDGRPVKRPKDTGPVVANPTNGGESS